MLWGDFGHDQGSGMRDRFEEGKIGSNTKRTGRLLIAMNFMIE